MHAIVCMIMGRPINRIAYLFIGLRSLPATLRLVIKCNWYVNPTLLHQLPFEKHYRPAFKLKCRYFFTATCLFWGFLICYHLRLIRPISQLRAQWLMTSRTMSRIELQYQLIICLFYVICFFYTQNPSSLAGFNTICWIIIGFIYWTTL